ncbi:MAG TPA: translocation/assembly module TamB domain-containing protein [Stellaceae bacterium]|nr:translocation/assembly module TamB domain-containing protein [Stellaceae bacterium]
MLARLSLRRLFRWIAVAFLFLLIIAAGAFGVLQTPIGLAWASRTAAGLASAPGFTVAVHGLKGIVPFDMRIERIEISDAKGAWLTLDDLRLDLSPTALLARRAEIHTLSVAAIEIARPPIATAPDRPTPLSETLKIPQLPMPVTVDRLAVDRLVLRRPILGDEIAAAIGGHIAQHGGDTQIALDLHRIDGVAGNLELQLSETGADPTLALRLTANEPTGILLDRLLNRSDRPPLTASLNGEGKLAQWHGKLEAAAGQLAHVSGEVALAAVHDTTVSLNGVAAVAKLLTPEMAALTGDAMPISATATLHENGAVSLDALSLQMAAGNLTADAATGGPDHAVSAHFRATLPKLAQTSELIGQPAQGSAKISATLAGTDTRPRLDIDASGDSLQVATAGAEHAEAHVALAWDGAPGEAATHITIAAHGQLRGVALPEATVRNLGRNIDWSLQASAAPDGSTVDLTQLSAQGAGIDISGSGRLADAGRSLDGKMRVAIADLRPLTGIFGHPVQGALNLDATAEQKSPGQVTAKLDGSITNFDAGIPALDALAGRSVAITGAAQRNPDGVLVLDKLTLAGAGANIAASGHYDPAKHQVASTADAEIGNLQPLGKALGSPLAGRVTMHVDADGPLDQPQIQVQLDGRSLVAGTASLDRVRLDAKLADLTPLRAAVSGDFQGSGIAGTLSLEARMGDHSDLTISGLQLKAAGSVIDADLRIDLASMLASGTINARAPDLSPWSRLAGTPLTGKLDLRAKLAAQRGLAIDLVLNGDGLSSGAGASRIALGHIGATAKLDDALGKPSGSAHVTATDAVFSAGGISNASLTLDSTQPGRLAWRADAKGTVREKLSIALDGAAEIGARGAATELQVAHLNGMLGPDRLQLNRPLTLSARGNDMAMSGLTLSVGKGQITGDASRRGAALSLQLAARDFDVATAGRLAGYSKAGGTLTFDAKIAGTMAAPQGRFNVSGRALRFSLAKQGNVPALGLDMSGDWNGRELALNGHVTGIKGDALNVTGSVPVALTQTPFGIAVPPQGRLSLRLQGGGEIGNLADLLPLGEDKVTGHFALDAAVNGTPAAPAASGQLGITDGRYENFITGAVLTHMRVDLVGDRDRLTLREFSADDTATGKLAAQGSVNLGGGSPIANLTATLQNFRILGRDDAVLTATGDAAIAGSLASPKVTARLTTGKGDLNIPDNLPPSVTKLQVVEIDSRAPRQPPSRTAKAPAKAAAKAIAKPTPPALPASLDITVTLPGQIFVRGRGLDSEWRGEIKVSGNSAAPHITGSLHVVRGTFDILGKTFNVTRGVIGFDGGTAIDPTIDILAEIAAGDITAQVMVTGTASAPKITLTSTPALPQEQILSYVLFNRSTTQITAAEGIQVAQAAATLAGGGPSVLDRLRSHIGLDRLALGGAPAGTASSNLNPAAGGSDASGTSVSGGKYVAPGVYVGAAQGLTPQSSKVVVEVEVHPHVTVEGDFSQTGGSGLGVNYKYDY